MFGYDENYQSEVINTDNGETSDDEISTQDGAVNGHGYVDLGLSVKWATRNVGASTQSDYGDYYAWGETTPKSTVYNSVTDGVNIADIAGNPEYDTARANWGDPWRMPTKEEMDELIEKCDCTWITIKRKQWL